MKTQNFLKKMGTLLILILITLVAVSCSNDIEVESEDVTENTTTDTGSTDVGTGSTDVGTGTVDGSDEGTDTTPTYEYDYEVDETTGAYTIYTADGLAAWNEVVVATLAETGASIDATLAADIDWNDLTSEYSWTPIGEINRYEGTFDGQNYTISNLVIDESTASLESVGFFGNLSNATIKNLGLINVTVVGNDSIGVHVGGIAGDVTASSIINCYVDGGTITGAYYAGGIAGFVNSRSSIEACWSDVTVESTFGTLDAAGGIAGYSAGSIIACYTASDVKDLAGVAYLGGVVGYNAGSVVSGYSTGTVTGVEGSTVGGVVGVNDGTLICCYYLEVEDVLIVGDEYVTSQPIGQEGSNPDRNGAAVTYSWDSTVLGYLNQGLTANEYSYSYTASAGEFPYTL